MLMCKSRYFAKCAESTLGSLSLPGFGSRGVSWGREGGGDRVTSIWRREGASNALVSFCVRC